MKDLDFRVSVLPTIFGEKIVMRILDKAKLMLDMTRLGFEAESLRMFEQAILKPYGMVLVTGPTGSGKTNTLYSALPRINTPEINIITAEDPVEFNLNGINQVQMKEQIGLNFATSLRSFLRQDPNIILVGEIRDFETAEVAIKAAMTGHLVISTLHTNDAPSSISRLMNMGMEPFLVATSVHMVVAQRLVRRICSYCKEPSEQPQAALTNIGFKENEARHVRLFRGRGCERCSNTGYKGRVGLYEVMEVDDETREMILAGAWAFELRQRSLQKGMLGLRGSGLREDPAGRHDHRRGGARDRRLTPGSRAAACFRPMPFPAGLGRALGRKLGPASLARTCRTAPPARWRTAGSRGSRRSAPRARSALRDGG